MNSLVKITIVIVLFVAAAGILILKSSTGANTSKEQAPVVSEAAKPGTANLETVASEATIPESTKTESASSGAAPLPRLVDLGSGKCIPCKMMAPILEELKKEYKGKFDVTFFDVYQIPNVAEQYSIQVIPTQIFYDATGKELFRHEGFFSKEDILNKWKEFGIQL